MVAVDQKSREWRSWYDCKSIKAVNRISPLVGCVMIMPEEIRSNSATRCILGILEPPIVYKQIFPLVVAAYMNSGMPTWTYYYNSVTIDPVVLSDMSPPLQEVAAQYRYTINQLFQYRYKNICCHTSNLPRSTVNLL